MTDRDRAGPPTNTPDSVEVASGSEDGMSGLVELFHHYPHTAGHLGGDNRARLSPALGAEGPRVLSTLQSGMSGSL